MFGLFKKKRSTEPENYEVSAQIERRGLPASIITGHAQWNEACERALLDRLDELGVPLNYQPDAQKAPSEEASSRYGHEPVLEGKNPIDEGILLRKMGCKQLYPRFLAIFAKSKVYLVCKNTNREAYQPRRPDDATSYIAVFSNLDRAKEGQKNEAKDYQDIEEKMGEAVLKKYSTGGIVINPGCPGITFAIPPEVVQELRRVLGLA